MMLAELRAEVVKVGMEALARGVVHGTAGNMSIRDPETDSSRSRQAECPIRPSRRRMLSSWTSMKRVVDGFRKPSSETPLHTMVMKHFPEVGAILTPTRTTPRS